MYHMYRLYGHENRELREISGKFSLGQFENLSKFKENQKITNHLLLDTFGKPIKSSTRKT